MLTEITLKDVPKDALLELLIIKMEKFKEIRSNKKADPEVYRIAQEEIKVLHKVIEEKMKPPIVESHPTSAYR